MKERSAAASSPSSGPTATTQQNLNQAFEPDCSEPALESGREESGTSTATSENEDQPPVPQRPPNCNEHPEVATGKHFRAAQTCVPLLAPFRGIRSVSFPAVSARVVLPINQSSSSRSGGSSAANQVAAFPLLSSQTSDKEHYAHTFPPRVIYRC
jgi:hypothetical protein